MTNVNLKIIKEGLRPPIYTKKIEASSGASLVNGVTAWGTCDDMQVSTSQLLRLPTHKTCAIEDCLTIML